MKHAKKKKLWPYPMEKNNNIQWPEEVQTLHLQKT